MTRSPLAKQALLQKVALFRPLDDQQKHTVANLLHEQTFSKGAHIFHQGDPGEVLYVIGAGRVRIYKVSAGGREFTLRIFGPGDLFGEFSVLDDQPRSAGAIAMDDLTVFAMHKADFWSLIEQHIVLARHIITSLTERIRYTTTYSENLAFFEVSERVAALLVQLTNHDPGAHDPMRIQLTQQELASFASTTREWINRALHEFAGRGLIRLERSAVVVLDREGLQRRIQGAAAAEERT